MSFVISSCRWLCGYGWQLLMKSPPPSQILLDFKPCHTLPLTNSAQSEAVVTFWSLRISIPFSTGAFQENNLMLVVPAIDISNSGFRSYFSRVRLPFSPHRHWMSAIWGRIKYLWRVDPQAWLRFYVSRARCFIGSLAEEHCGSANPSSWWGAKLAAGKGSFDARFLSDGEVMEVKRLSI